MLIKNIFKRKISRHIDNPIIITRQEKKGSSIKFDEYVITQELTRHIIDFLNSFTTRPHMSQIEADLNADTSVWVSGSFGSGKSHLLAALKYLLLNPKLLVHDIESNAISFFEDKHSSEIIFDAFKRLAELETEVILIRPPRDANGEESDNSILALAISALNEHQGYCKEYPFIAEIERELKKSGEYHNFKEVFNELTDRSWDNERCDFVFYEEAITEALSITRGKSSDRVRQWLIDLKNDFSIDIPQFCDLINTYIKESNCSKVVFMIDDIDLLIGIDSNRMRELQALAEGIGIYCDRNAWLIVTAQRDIFAQADHLKKYHGDKSLEFFLSFARRIQVSSSNSMEIVQRRLLEKSIESRRILEELFITDGYTLQRNLALHNCDSLPLPAYTHAEDFIAYYPFVPYQHALLSELFSSLQHQFQRPSPHLIGVYAFLNFHQHTLVQFKNEIVGLLVPFYSFYAAVETHLDPSTRRVIETALENYQLAELDGNVLRLLLLLSHIKSIKSHLENLTTLCIYKIDMDRLKLREEIHSSLERLNKKSLIENRNEEFYISATG